MSMFRRRNAFTLIEVLIVVIIMAVLAATIIPQFSMSTNDAKNSAVTFNLHTIRSQIEMYRVHHPGKLPGPTAQNFTDQMTKKTDATGALSDAGPYGPYVQGQLPANPFNGKSTVSIITAAAATGDDSTGWQYDKTGGGFYPNSLPAVWDYTNDKPAAQ
jgi:general secretion pathway protein G